MWHTESHSKSVDEQGKPCPLILSPGFSAFDYSVHTSQSPSSLVLHQTSASQTADPL
jgi:hypothetical protein